MQQFVRQIELDIEAVGRRPSSPYMVEGMTAMVRTIDAGTATLEDVRAVLATLIGDLKRSGRLA